jgi:hypothetical protein
MSTTSASSTSPKPSVAPVTKEQHRLLSAIPDSRGRRRFKVAADAVNTDDYPINTIQKRMQQSLVCATNAQCTRRHALQWFDTARLDGKRVMAAKLIAPNEHLRSERSLGYKALPDTVLKHTDWHQFRMAKLA